MINNSPNQDLTTILNRYLKQWKWFLLVVIIALGVSFMYLRYSVPKYSAIAKIQILADSKGTSELSVLEDLNVFSQADAKIEDEVELLKSRSNFIAVVNKLKLNFRYYVIGNIKDKELYNNDFPFNVSFLAADSIVNKSRHEFFVKLNSDISFGYSEETAGPFKTYSFGSGVKTKIGDVVLTPNITTISKYDGQVIKVIVNPIPLVAQDYQTKVNVTSADKLSNILNITLTDPIKQRAIDVINSLIEINNDNAVEDKKSIADKTSKFINDRISDIYSNLSSVDQTAETYKASRGIADLGSQSNVNFTQSAASEKQLQDVSIQLNIANSMKDLIGEQEGFDFIPTNVGLSDQGIAGTAQRYNELVAQRNRLLESSSEKHPAVVELDRQLEGLQKGMRSSLNNVSNNLNLQVNSLSKQLSQINSRIYAAPSNERALRDISRRQQTTEQLYLYLLQKREESQITFASASPKSKIVDSAYSAGIPVSPKPKFVIVLAVMLGFLIPFSVIYAQELLDNKIHNKIDLENLISNIPVIAEVPRLLRKESKIIQDNDRSVLAESLRILRTNLSYIFKSSDGEEGSGKTIFVTSSVPGEGKTFLSSNLSLIFASTNKKVLLLGADIRNPKIYRFFSEGDESNEINKKRVLGLTDYLTDPSLPVQEIVQKLHINSQTIDIISSGKIPPNPAELLMNKRVADIFKSLRNEYDYIIVDTAPLMVVADTLLINQYADQTLYVTKAGFTERKVLEYPLKLKKEGKLKKLSFVVNNVKQSNLGYGGKYGYGYGKTVKKWWKFS
nr:polysaccharide biosynthesis tyrosine autokinase [uncultured Allomuricauda sp.]